MVRFHPRSPSLSRAQPVFYRHSASGAAETCPRPLRLDSSLVRTRSKESCRTCRSAVRPGERPVPEASGWYWTGPQRPARFSAFTLCACTAWARDRDRAGRADLPRSETWEMDRLSRHALEPSEILFAEIGSATIKTVKLIVISKQRCVVNQSFTYMNANLYYRIGNIYWKLQTGWCVS